jgi:hypothetical protein
VSKAHRVPKRLKQRPQWRGLPIPYIALIKPDGQPDFRVTDEQKRRSVMLNRFCQLCGDPLGRWFFFTGGPDCAKANMYFEPAAHLDCLIYAMQVCPFIVGRIEHADTDKIVADNPGLTVKVDSNFATERNPLWIIKKANAYSYARTSDGTIMLVPTVVKETKPLHPETMTPQDWQRTMEWLLQ